MLVYALRKFLPHAAKFAAELDAAPSIALPPPPKKRHKHSITKMRRSKELAHKAKLHNVVINGKLKFHFTSLKTACARHSKKYRECWK
jgi:hypothetical protein